MKPINLFLFSALLFFACANVHAQVTIGGLGKAATGALLDLNSTNKGGLQMSNVTITSQDSIPFGTNVFPGITEATADVNMELRGVMVYNNGLGTTVPAGMYIWTGYSWTKDGSLNPASLPAGKGVFTGVTCLDLVQGNDNANGCAALAGVRQNQKTDFSNRTPQTDATANYSGVQVYTFTPTGTVSRVRFAYVETSGVSIDKIEPESATYATGDNISTICKVTVHYRETLNSALRGTTRATGHKLKLYAIYNSDATYSNPAKDQMLELGVSLQDCNCCGAYTNADKTQWLNFMCHNLGATLTADPFIPAAAIHGAKYKWGVIGYAVTQEEDQANNNGFANWSTIGGTPPTSKKDWDMTNANPCPTGWRVPTQAEWKNVLLYNTVVHSGTWSTTDSDYTNFASGLKIGDDLFLPAAGHRTDNGLLDSRGRRGYYWSTANLVILPYTFGYYLHFGREKVSDDIHILNYDDRNGGLSVRCVAD
jgi:uncharacterized protein (TIGR02145 family)